MVRMLISLVFLLAANAVGLIVAALLLADMEVSVGSFLIAVAIFTVVNALARPFIMKMAMKQADSLAGGTALIATLVSLIVTAILAQGFTIRGADTWLMATLIVWLASILAGVILPAIFVKRRIDDRRG